MSIVQYGTDNKSQLCYILSIVGMYIHNGYPSFSSLYVVMVVPEMTFYRWVSL